MYGSREEEKGILHSMLGTWNLEHGQSGTGAKKEAGAWEQSVTVPEWLFLFQTSHLWDWNLISSRSMFVSNDFWFESKLCRSSGNFQVVAIKVFGD